MLILKWVKYQVEVHMKFTIEVIHQDEQWHEKQQVISKRCQSEVRRCGQKINE